MSEIWGHMSESTTVLITLAVILVSGFLMTRLTNALKLPRVSGYIIAGVVIGPSVLHMIPGAMVKQMGFVSDIALAFIAFGVGKFFKKEVLMRTGKAIIFITVCEALAAGFLITLAMHFLFRLSWDFSLILGAIATATAPASTMMTINQYKAKGEFVNTLLQVVALDDVVCLLSFSVVSALVNGRMSGEMSASSVILPVVYNLVAIVLGAVCGYILSKLLTPQRSRDNRLILVIAMLCGLSGICSAFDISPLLSCMVLGAVYINLTKDKKLYRQIGNFTPPVMSIFFIVSGMSLDLTTFRTVGMVGVAYFFIRIVGKYLGTYGSCVMTKRSPEISKYMGLALVPQAGVAIGLAFLGQRLLPPEAGNLVMTIILSSSVLYEMVGPVCAKKALIFSGAISQERLEAEQSASLTVRRSTAAALDKGGNGNLAEKKPAPPAKKPPSPAAKKMPAPAAKKPLIIPGAKKTDLPQDEKNAVQQSGKREAPGGKKKKSSKSKKSG